MAFNTYPFNPYPASTEQINKGDTEGLQEQIGDLSDLETETKTSIVGAVNEVNGKADDNTTAIGDLSDLETTVKTSIVGAVNEVSANKLVNYSTEEQKAGQKWIDGKDIYFKVVTITTDTQITEKAYSLGLQATDTIVQYDASLLGDNGNIVNNNYFASTSDCFVTYIKPDNTINMVCASWARGQTATVIVYYTKTT